MTWLAWRHQRTETLVAGVILALLAAWLVPTGLHIASLYHRDGIAACVAHCVVDPPPRELSSSASGARSPCR
jgi:hypothetical protein